MVVQQPQEINIYARAAILEWVSDILHGDYSTFSDIEAKDVAVLLHAIFNFPGGSGDAVGENTVASLHDIQFCENPTSTTRFLNAQRVLSLVQGLSSSADESSLEDGGSHGRVAPSSVGNMTACAWMDGKAFVEELKMWRWIRGEAQRRGLDTHELEHRAQAFLCGADKDSCVPELDARRMVEVDGNVPAVVKDVVDEDRNAPLRKRLRGEEKSGISPYDNAVVASTTAGAAGRGAGVVEVKSRSATESGVTTDSGGRQAGKGAEAVILLPQEDALKDEAPTPSLLNVACDGVAAAPQLLDVLEMVKQELEEQKAAAGEITSAAPRVGEVHAMDDPHTTGRPALCCVTCPSVFALAIQKNYDAIEKLEAVRRMAVAACLKRDAAGLLEALAFV